jgi:hypothetical protein
MTENNFQSNRKLPRGKDGLTFQNRQLVDNERNRRLAKTGILVPRYAIINEAVHKAFGGVANG